MILETASKYLARTEYISMASLEFSTTNMISSAKRATKLVISVYFNITSILYNLPVLPRYSEDISNRYGEYIWGHKKQFWRTQTITSSGTPNTEGVHEMGT